MTIIECVRKIDLMKISFTTMRMEASKMKNKHSYMQRLGAMAYSMNRMNTYMGLVTEADRDCLEVLRNMRR